MGWLFLAISMSQMRCSTHRVPENLVYEVTGSQAERISAITTLIAKHQQAPSLILDAHFIQEQLGDGVYGWVALSPRTGPIHSFSFTT